MTRCRSYSHNTVDDIAVQRRLDGDVSVPLTIAERRALVARLHALGLNDTEIADRGGMSSRTVLRIRNQLGLPSNFLAQLERDMSA